MGEVVRLFPAAEIEEEILELTEPAEPMSSGGQWWIAGAIFALLLGGCDLDEWRGTGGSGEKVGQQVHNASSKDDEPAEEEPVEEEPVEPVDPQNNPACWGDITLEQWEDNNCPGDPPN
jgi:hypothetical protein